MKKALVLFALLLVLAMSSYARRQGQWNEGLIGIRKKSARVVEAAALNTSNANLNGVYVFKVAGAHLYQWGQQLTCNGSPTFVGGMEVRDDVVIGTITFDGAGHVSGTGTEYGKLDSAASNATVSCASGGTAIYQAPITQTFSGTYSIQSDGTGTMSLNVASGVFELRLAGGCTALGVSNTVMIDELRTDNAADTTGVARLQQ